MRGGKRLLATLFLACLVTPMLADDVVDPSQAAIERARKLLAQRLANDAMLRSRQLTAPSVADEATILLQSASRLDPDNTRLLRLLAEAARSSTLPGKIDIEKDALKNVIRLDHDDLVSQVAYFDLAAGATQAIDQRARIYRGALDSESLNTQVRAEMAVRLSKIASERGDMDSAKGFIQQALSLNDVSISALTENVKLADPTPQAQLQAIVTLLAANPLQPDVWVSAAASLSTGGAHDRAADCLVVAIDQWQTAGKPAPAEVYQTMGVELAISGRLQQAQPYLTGLAKIQDAPLSALVAARLLMTEYNPATTSKPAATEDAAATAPATLSSDDLNTLIRTRLRQSVAADPKAPAPLAEAAWIELSAMSEVSADTGKWINDYAALVAADDPTLARLKAWQLYRDGKLEEARTQMQKLAATGDPLAQLGLARIDLQENKRDLASKQLQEIWSAQPTGLLAFQVAQTARSVHIALADPASARQLAQVLATLPTADGSLHRNPGNLALVSGTFTQRSFNQGEPVLLNVRITNTSGHAAPVGTNGLIKANLALLATTRGMGAQNLGMVGIEDLQRCYRLDRGATLEGVVRVDQGSLADKFQSNPLSTMTLGITLKTNPEILNNNLLPGLGGQTISVGDFDRTGAGILPGIQAVPAIMKLTQDATGMTVDKQMLLTDQFLRLLDSFTEKQIESVPDDAKDKVAGARKAMLDVIKDFAGSSSPEVRAWAVRLVPATGIPQEILDRIAKSETDPDPTVRMMWGIRQMANGSDDAESRKHAADVLEKRAGEEKDPTVRRWFMALAEDSRAAAK